LEIDTNETVLLLTEGIKCTAIYLKIGYSEYNLMFQYINIMFYKDLWHFQ